MNVRWPKKVSNVKVYEIMCVVQVKPASQTMKIHKKMVETFNKVTMIIAQQEQH